MDQIITRRFFTASLPLVALSNLCFGRQVHADDEMRRIGHSLRLRVSLKDQRAQLDIDGKPAYPIWKCSTADSNHTDCTSGACRTPVGTFIVTRTNPHIYSPKWDVWMDDAVFFGQIVDGKLVDDGDAVHAATYNELGQLGHVASHGCVRLAPKYAGIFFGLAAKHRHGNSWPGVSVDIRHIKLEVWPEHPVVESLKI